MHRAEESWICHYGLQIPRGLESEREESLHSEFQGSESCQKNERKVSMKKLLTNSALKHFCGVRLEVNKIQFISSSKETFPLISKEFLATAVES